MIGFTFCLNGKDFFVAKSDAPKKYFIYTIRKKLKGKRITPPSTSFLMESLVPCQLERDTVFGDRLDHQFVITGVEVLA